MTMSEMPRGFVRHDGQTLLQGADRREKSSCEGNNEEGVRVKRAW